MKLLVLLSLIAGVASNLIFGQCSLNSCENQGICRDVNGTHHICECLDYSHSGLRCETTKSCEGPNCPSTGIDSTCSSQTCANGYCLGHKCICDSGWTGDRCSTDIDECSLSPCAEGSTCLNKNGSFECICPEGRNGLRCENGGCSSDRECFNGGHCVDSACICQPHFEGPNCERESQDPCSSLPCSHGRVCLRNQSEILGFSCVCPPGLGGRFCDQPLRSYNSRTQLSQCSLSGCSQLAGNGFCNQECNHFACGFDGGDCSVGTVPFSSCPDASYCARHFKDGKCDEQCNNEKCLFDGFDCVGPEPEIRKNGTMTDVTLIILVKPATFVSMVDDFLKSLADRLRTTVIIKKSEGEMDVFEWNSKTGEGPRVDFGSRTDARVEVSRRSKRSVQEEVLSGILVVVQVDLSECTRGCFSDAYAVAQFIEAAEEKEPLNPAMPIHSALIVKDKEKSGSSTPALLPWLLLVGVVIACTVVVVGTKRRNVKTAPVWTPPTADSVRQPPNPLTTNGYNVYHNLGEPLAKMPSPSFKAPSTLSLLSSSSLSLLSSSTHTLLSSSSSSLVSSRPPAAGNQIQWPQGEEREGGRSRLPEVHQLERAAIGRERLTPQMRSLSSLPTRYSRTPLHLLAMNSIKSAEAIMSDVDLVLISFKVDVNQQDEDGNTALHYACQNARPSMVRRLLEAGANPAIENELDMTPLHVAAKNCDDLCIEVLIGHKFYKDKTNLDLVDLEDRTALMHYAANSCQSIRGAELLLKAGADVNYAGDKKRMHSYRGRTALHHAAEWNSVNTEMIEFLVGKNANKDAQDVEEATPLWLATNQNNLMAVTALIKAGASLDFADQTGHTPHELARAKDYREVQERLRLAELRKRPLGLGMPMFAPTTFTAPRTIKKPRRTLASTSSHETTPSPPELKASSSSGPSCLDSPHSDQGGRLSSSSEIGSPHYTQQPLQPLQQLQPAAMRPSPPYDTHDSNSYPSLAAQSQAYAYPSEQPLLNHVRYQQYPTNSFTYENQQ